MRTAAGYAGPCLRPPPRLTWGVGGQGKRVPYLACLSYQDNNNKPPPLSLQQSGFQIRLRFRGRRRS